MKVLKLGGSFLTKKDGYREADVSAIQSAARMVANLWKKGVRDIIVVHGAGSFGHSLVIHYGIKDGITTDQQLLGYADTHAACSELSQLLVKALVAAGVPAISISPNSIIRSKNKRIYSFDEILILKTLDSGLLPVLYGDMVPDSELVASVCSGDQIVAYLGKKAEFLVLATNVDGVLDDSGKVIASISSSNFKAISKHLKRAENDVTGAMAGKLKELLAIGTVSYIVNAAHPERVEALMQGKKAICTEVRK